MKNENRYKQSNSPWIQSFDISTMKVLIVCRGPIRLEAMEVFEGQNVTYGILLSEKDSVSYPHTLAPEIRMIHDPKRIHRVPDYTGASGEERKERINQIVGIAQSFGYTHVFAGYGFMAEDAGFVEAIEQGGIKFMGPSSPVHKALGAKDQAKKLARNMGVSVTPGIDRISAITLLSKTGNSKQGLTKLATEKGLNVSPTDELEDYAESILEESYKRSVPLVTMADLQVEAKRQMEKLFGENPGKRFRFKYIGGGGGKGQRIVSKIDEVENAVKEVLQESKATADADNKNFLIEINIEQTRHNEIQLIGNGTWALALGGRDCSLQMHEQKLVELSITDELYALEIQNANTLGQSSFAKTLEKDRALLKQMEDQAERLASGVGLDSASTFECIVSGDSFYFMEVNTRIQVEHRVTEMAYSLRFENPNNANDFFVIESLVEAMALCAAHGSKLPKPTRVGRHIAGGEVRLNAMNEALAPHAGGLIESWSSPAEFEQRDDQGIGIRNPDTGAFIHYYLAGAYDSNIALVVTYGKDRKENLERLSNILRKMEIRGIELKTNRDFHYGIINFCLGFHPMIKPDTRFAVPYLTAVGSLARAIDQIDAEMAWDQLKAKTAALGPDHIKALLAKHTLLLRPLQSLLANPHAFMGWLFLNQNRSFKIDGSNISWLENPLNTLENLYRYLRLEDRANTTAAQKIWSHDKDLLSTGLEFYDDLQKKSGKTLSYQEWDSLLKSSATLPGMDTELSEQCKAAHLGFQLGLDILKLLPQVGLESGVFEFTMDDQLVPIVPKRFLDPAEMKVCLKYLSPPPVAAADEIVAVSGGMFYAKETPDSPAYLDKGKHFNVGDTLYIIEVMKMFNKVNAEFAGTVTDVLMGGDSGSIVRKGQPLFKVKPDEEIHIESESEKIARRKQKTKTVMDAIIS